MPNIRRAKQERKATEPVEVTSTVARDLFGDIIAKARLLEQRTVITRNGKAVAAIIPIVDYERLTAA